MNYEALMAAIRAVEIATPQDDPGATTEQIAERLGLGKDAAIRRIREAVRSGRIKSGWAYRKNIVGRVCRVPVYSEVVDGSGPQAPATETPRDGRGTGEAGDRPGA